MSSSGAQGRLGNRPTQLTIDTLTPPRRLPRPFGPKLRDRVAGKMIGPTGWSGYTALPVWSAVDMLVDAIVRRPAHSENPIGAPALWMGRLTPASPAGDYTTSTA